MLEFEIESLDGVDDSLKSLYSEHEGKFRLQVKGIDPADELKKALANERNQSKETKTKLVELERLKQELEEKQLQEKQQFETLWKSEKEAKTKTLQELEALKNSISEKERDAIAMRIVSAIGKNDAEIKALKREALDYIQSAPDGIAFNGVNDENQLREKMVEFYTQIKGNQSSGGGANGNTNGKGANLEMKRDEFTTLQPDAQMKFIKDGGKII